MWGIERDGRGLASCAVCSETLILLFLTGFAYSDSNLAAATLKEIRFSSCVAQI